MTRLVVMLVVSVAACSNTRLEYPDEEVVAATVDNEVAITGRVCASPASDARRPKSLDLLDSIDLDASTPRIASRRSRRLRSRP